LERDNTAFQFLANIFKIGGFYSFFGRKKLATKNRCATPPPLLFKCKKAAPTENGPTFKTKVTPLLSFAEPFDGQC